MLAPGHIYSIEYDLIVDASALDIPRATLQLNGVSIPGSGFEEQGEFTTNGGTVAGGGLLYKLQQEDQVY